MSNFCVGDLLELVTVDNQSHAANIGYRGVVIKAEVWPNKGPSVQFPDGEWARAVNCRKIDPPNKDEFTAGEWELCPWQPKRVTA